jgi:hypothetical protein
LLQNELPQIGNNEDELLKKIYAEYFHKLLKKGWEVGGREEESKGKQEVCCSQ